MSTSAVNKCLCCDKLFLRGEKALFLQSVDIGGEAYPTGCGKVLFGRSARKPRTLIHLKCFEQIFIKRAEVEALEVIKTKKLPPRRIRLHEKKATVKP